MISRESVLRDLRLGREVRRCWAPEAVDALIAEGLVSVRAKGRLSRPTWRVQAARLRLSQGPTTTYELVDSLAVTRKRVCQIARALGAVKFMAHDAKGRWTAVWRLP